MEDLVTADSGTGASDGPCEHEAPLRLHDATEGGVVAAGSSSISRDGDVLPVAADVGMSTTGRIAARQACGVPIALIAQAMRSINSHENEGITDSVPTAVPAPSVDLKASEAAAISTAIRQALIDLSQAVEWILYGRQDNQDHHSDLDVRNVLLNITADGMPASGLLSDSSLRSVDAIDIVVEDGMDAGIMSAAHSTEELQLAAAVASRAAALLDAESTEAPPGEEF